MMHPQVLISGLLLLLPAAVDSFPEVHGVVGHPVILPCTYPVSNGISSMCWGRGGCGDSCEQTLMWTDDQRIYYQTSNRYQLKGQLLEGDESLTIENATESDSGLYCCRVEMKGPSGVQRLTISLKVQPGVPTSSSRRFTNTNKFKPINAARPASRKTKTTPRKPVTTPRKPITTPRRPATKKPKTTIRRPSTTPKSTTIPRRPSTTIKPKTTPGRPTPPVKPTSTPSRLSTVTKSTPTTRRPSTTTKPTTTKKRPSTTTKPTTTTRRPSTTTKPTTTTRRPSTTTKPTTTTRRPSTTTKLTTTTRRPSTTTKPTTIPRTPTTTITPITTPTRPTTTRKLTTTSTRFTDSPKSTRIFTYTPPPTTNTLTPKSVYTNFMTSSRHPWSNHTEVAPTPHHLKSSTKSLYIGISMSAVMLLLAGILLTIQCRHTRKKRKPENSVVFHAYQNKTFQCQAQPQGTEDKFNIIDDKFFLKY